MTNPEIVNYTEFTVESGQTSPASGVSTGLVSNGQYQLHGFEFPDTMTSSTATLTGSRSIDGTYVTIREVGGSSSYSIGVAASVFVPLDPRVFATYPFVKLVLGSSEGADRTIVAHLRRVS